MRRRIIAASAATLVALGTAVFAFLPSARTAGVSRFALGSVRINDGVTLNITVFNPTSSDVTVTLDIRDRSGFVASFPDQFEVPAGQQFGIGIPCINAVCEGVPLVSSPSGKIVLSADWTPSGVSTREFANAGDWRKIS